MMRPWVGFADYSVEAEPPARRLRSRPSIFFRSIVDQREAAVSPSPALPRTSFCVDRGGCAWGLHIATLFLPL